MHFGLDDDGMRMKQAVRTRRCGPDDPGRRTTTTAAAATGTSPPMMRLTRWMMQCRLHFISNQTQTQGVGTRKQKQKAAMRRRVNQGRNRHGRRWAPSGTRGENEEWLTRFPLGSNRASNFQSFGNRPGLRKIPGLVRAPPHWSLGKPNSAAMPAHTHNSSNNTRARLLSPQGSIHPSFVASFLSFFLALLRTIMVQTTTNDNRAATPCNNATGDKDGVAATAVPAAEWAPQTPPRLQSSMHDNDTNGLLCSHNGQDDDDEERIMWLFPPTHGATKKNHPELHHRSTSSSSSLRNNSKPWMFLNPSQQFCDLSTHTNKKTKNDRHHSMRIWDDATDENCATAWTTDTNSILRPCGFFYHLWSKKNRTILLRIGVAAFVVVVVAVFATGTGFVVPPQTAATGAAAAASGWTPSLPTNSWWASFGTTVKEQSSYASAVLLDARTQPQRVLFASPGDPAARRIAAAGSPRRPKPKLVIHIGPHKTASTTLQTDLTYYQDILRLDNYKYLGRYYHPTTVVLKQKNDSKTNMDSSFVKLNRTPDSKLQTYFRDVFAKCWHPPSSSSSLSSVEYDARDDGDAIPPHVLRCAQELRDTLWETYARRPSSWLPKKNSSDTDEASVLLPNLLISDEAFLKLYEDNDENNNNKTATINNNHYVWMTQVLGRDWDIVIAVAYRRFYEWLPSAKYQKDKPTAERRSTEWPNATALMAAAASRSTLDGTATPLATTTTIMEDFYRTVHKATEAGGGIPLLPLFPLPAPPTFQEHDEQDLFRRTAAVLNDWSREHFLSERSVATIERLTKGQIIPFPTKIGNIDNPVAVPPPIQLKIYHLYGKLTVRTHFLCHVLPQADAACRASHRDDAVRPEPTRFNARSGDNSGGSGSSSDTDIIVTEYPYAYFDALAVAAAGPRWNLINASRWNRQTVAANLQHQYITASTAWQEEQQQQQQQEQLRQRQQQELIDLTSRDNIGDMDETDVSMLRIASTTNDLAATNPSGLYNKNPWELPLLCPTAGQLEQLLRMSLALEARFLPKLYRKSATEHTSAFHAALRKSPVDYCWIDTDALLSGDATSEATAGKSDAAALPFIFWKDYIESIFS